MCVGFYIVRLRGSFQIQIYYLFIYFLNPKTGEHK